MNEQFKDKKDFTLEDLENKLYEEFKAAESEKDRIMKEIDDILANTPDRVEAEKIILEKYARLMDEAAQKSAKALEAWFNAMEKSNERETKEINDME